MWEVRLLRRRKKQRFNKHRRNGKHYGNDSCYASDHDEAEYDEYDYEEENCDENAVLNRRDSNNSEHHPQTEMHRDARTCVYDSIITTITMIAFVIVMRYKA